MDLVAAFYSRLYPDPTTPAERVEYEKLYGSMVRNIPEIGLENDIGLLIGSKGYQHAEQAKQALGEGVPLRVFGPIVRSFMTAFAARVGLALHYSETGRIVPSSGAVLSRVFTNTALLRGDLPEEFFEGLGQFRALKQKGLEAEKDFAYAISVGQDLPDATMCFFRLRLGVGGVVLCLPDESALDDGKPNGFTRFKPGFLRSLDPTKALHSLIQPNLPAVSVATRRTPLWGASRWSRTTMVE